MRRAALAIALIAVCAAGSIVVVGANKPQTTFSDSGPEPQLFRILAR
jgi:hypothetical protein